MHPKLAEELPLIGEADQEELTKLVNAVALSDRTLTLFAIAPESAPDHPVVKHLQRQLDELAEPLQFLTFFYSDNSLFNFLADLDSQSPPGEGRRVILAFGLEQLPTPRLKNAMEQLNLAREAIFERNLVLIFWLNREYFLDEFRSRAPDFWDWRGKVASFVTHHPLLYPYLEWLIAENSYLKMSGVMQVNRQVDIFLDQIYVSLQAERRLHIDSTSTKHQPEAAGRIPSPLKSTSSSSSLGDLEAAESGLPFDMFLEMGRELEALESATSSSKTVTETVDLADVVRGQNSCSVILGAPGAGKTTLLRYLALHFAKAKRDDAAAVQGEATEEELGSTRLPIFFRVADYAERLEAYPDLSLLDYLVQFYRRWEDYFDDPSPVPLASRESEESLPELPRLLLTEMGMGDCLILLDGLDEVFDQESRRRIVGRINDFAEQYSNNKIIVTSRIAGYQEVKLSSRFLEFTITDMGDEQVSQFLHRWCLAVEQAQKTEASADQQERDGDRQAELILQDIRKNAGVKRLTANPLLLTILALIHRNGERLPERRVKLYELAVQTLTADWQLSKKLPNMQKVLLPEGEVVALLAPLAYWMHEEKPSGLVTHVEVQQQLAPELAELRGEDRDAPVVQQAVEEFLRRVRETTGLFVERAPNVYGFMHLTFEEYFAARHIADNDRSDVLALIQHHWHEPRWEEPILLALSYYGSYSPRLINRLVEDLFRGLEAYQPTLGRDRITLRNAASPNALIVRARAEELDAVQEFRLKDLLFAGQLVAQVEEVNASLRKKVIYQLVATTLALTMDLEEDVAKQLLQLLRQIEQFHRQGEVAAILELVAGNTALSKEMRLKAQAVKLYVVCDEADASLIDCVTEFVQQMEPDLFCILRELVDGVGEDMSAALETLRQQQWEESAVQRALTFMTAMTYVREKHYDQAIPLFEAMTALETCHLAPYIAWSLASCYQEKENYAKANDFYQECFEQLAPIIEPNSLLIYWKNRGVCRRLHSKYEQALDCFQQMFTLARELLKPEEEALAFHHIARTYEDWGKYADAIAQHEQSCALYEQLGKVKNVRNQLYHLGDAYKSWGKYELALEYQQQSLEKCHDLADEPGVALAYYRLGLIYQAWGKYKEAIAQYEQSHTIYQQLENLRDAALQTLWLALCYKCCEEYGQALKFGEQALEAYRAASDTLWMALSLNQLGLTYQAWDKYGEAVAAHEQSRDLYEQLGQEQEVANLWWNLADCYREWGKYEQAISHQQHAWELRQTLDDPALVAISHFQFGRIYYDWGKYGEAIEHYQQSRDLYEQLGREQDVANRWKDLADCYQEWGKYEQAISHQQHAWELRQTLDDPALVAISHFQFGRIYYDWGKYGEAIEHYQQSRDLYEQLGREQDVANQWWNLADCYRGWGKYEQAISHQQHAWELRQTLDDPALIAASHFQFGYIYEAWGKYGEAIEHYQQSRDLYEQLGREQDVANRWKDLADCYREWGKYEQAISHQQHAWELRQTLDDPALIAASHFQFGRIYEAWGKYGEAIEHYQQSRDLYEQLGREKDVANRWKDLADCYQEWGKYEQAISHQQHAWDLRQTMDDAALIAASHSQFGYIYEAWGKYGEAIEHYQQSRELYEQLGKEKEVANRWKDLADCYRRWGKYEQAIIHQQHAWDLRQTMDDAALIATSHFQFGRIYQAWGKYGEAIEHYQQSRDLYEQLGKEKEVANQWKNLAYCCREWGKYEQAISHQQHAWELRQTLDDPALIAASHFQFGYIYEAWGKYGEAIEHYQQSRDLYEQLGREQDVANQWKNLADCYQEWGKYEQAISHQQHAWELCQTMDDAALIAFSHFQFGYIYEAWGKYGEAIEHYQQSRELYEQLGQEKEVANLWTSLAYCYREWSKYEQAISHQQHAWELRQTLDDPALIAASHFQFGYIYEAWGKYGEAIEHYQQSRDLYEQLGREQEVANRWKDLADCYQELKQYTVAFEHYQQSCDLAKAADLAASVAHRLRQMSSVQVLLVKDTLTGAAALEALTQAEQTLQRAMQLNRTNDYRENLAYDHAVLALLHAERLRMMPANDAAIPDLIAQFEEAHQTGLATFAELGQHIDRAEAALDIARAYLEVETLKNCDRAEDLAGESLKVFQTFNRRKLEASARKLLGEIYLSRSQQNQVRETGIARQFLLESQRIYQDLDLADKATEVETLLQTTLL